MQPQTPEEMLVRCRYCGISLMDDQEDLCGDCRKAEVGCPCCGEVGGYPVTVYSREYQGESPHGGMVEWEEQMCSLCERKYR